MPKRPTYKIDVVGDPKAVFEENRVVIRYEGAKPETEEGLNLVRITTALEIANVLFNETFTDLLNGLGERRKRIIICGAVNENFVALGASDKENKAMKKAVAESAWETAVNLQPSGVLRVQDRTVLQIRAFQLQNPIGPRGAPFDVNSIIAKYRAEDRILNVIRILVARKLIVYLNLGYSLAEAQKYALENPNVQGWLNCKTVKEYNKHRREGAVDVLEAATRTAASKPSLELKGDEDCVFIALNTGRIERETTW